MKILCDVCGANEAAVLCCADEAALCSDCDRRVHRANKLAGKHPRLSLFSSSPQPHPLCDICKERRALVFCKEDRAILCYECDFSIHAANDFTMKHSRFILTGTRLSSASTTTSSPSSEQSTTKRKVSEPISSLMADCSSSSISEYLIKMLPGYHFEDFLFDDSIDHCSGDVFHQSDALAPLVKGDLDFGVAKAADWNFCPPCATASSSDNFNRLRHRHRHRHRRCQRCKGVIKQRNEQSAPFPRSSGGGYRGKSLRRAMDYGRSVRCAGVAKCAREQQKAMPQVFGLEFLTILAQL